MDVAEIVKDCYRPYLRSECEMIQRRTELGMSLRPSRMYPVVTRGLNATVDFSEAGLRLMDRELSLNCLNWLARLRAEYPEMVAEFAPALSAAEKVWSGCLAA